MSSNKFNKGRRMRLDQAQKQQVLEYLKQGKSQIEAAHKFGFGRSTIYKLVSDSKQKVPELFKDKRPSPYTPEIKKEILEYLKEGHTQKQTAKKFNCSIGSISGWVNSKDKKESYHQIVNSTPIKYEAIEIPEKPQIKKSSSKIAVVISDDPQAILDVLRGM